MIDIIIPVSKSHEEINQTLYSIAYQDDSNLVKVWLISSGKDNYDDEIKFFSKFIDINVLTVPNNSMLRQYGVECTNSEYIMFMNAGDVLVNSLAICALCNKIKNDYDIVVSTVLKEANKELVIYPYVDNFLEGKIYRRSFLEENNLKFSGDKICEKISFAELSNMLCTNFFQLEEQLYAYRNDDDNISLNWFRSYVNNMYFFLEKLIEKKFVEKIVSEKAFAILVECYYYYLKFHNHDVHDVLNNLKKIKGFIGNYPISQDVKIKIYDEQYAKVINKIDKEDWMFCDVTFKKYFKMLDEGEN